MRIAKADRSFVAGKRLSEITARLVGEIVAARRKQSVTNATIKRDLVALSSVMNNACLHQWTESNPVLPWLNNVKERRDPILLPRRQDIELVISRARQLAVSDPGGMGDRWPRRRAGEGQASPYRSRPQRDDVDREG